ncbi:MAG: DUF3109 family protein [Firmicutes bacterium]|nr:DUF3109 family protein [Bacillota bacterium]
MIEVGGIFVENEIFTEYFLCDIKKCFGDCCTFPGVYGAPLTEAEAPILEEQFEKVKHLLSAKSLDWIKKNGVVEFASGRPTTVCINKRDCVFVYYSDKVALCSIEKEFLDGNTNFRKPISCWLFPIRVGVIGNSILLYYEKISECSSAIKNGERQKMKIYQTLREPLIAFLGESWYNELIEIAMKFE